MTRLKSSRRLAGGNVTEDEVLIERVHPQTQPANITGRTNLPKRVGFLAGFRR